MGVDPSAIRVILATHWHDDHVGGIAALYEAAVNAELVLPLAMTTNEFKAFAATTAQQPLGGVSSGIAELMKLGEVRKAQGRPAPKRVQAATTVFRKKTVTASAEREIVLTALSPSAADVEEFLDYVSGPFAPSPIIKRMMPQPNDISVACWLGFSNGNALFGADLEQVPNPERGWNAVMSSTAWPRAMASVFKVAHHGSENGHNDLVWTDLLHPGATAILAPFNKGRGVPKGSDVQRILKLTDSAYTTTQSPFRRYQREGVLVEKSLEATGIKINSLPLQTGAVRLRTSFEGEAKWTIEKYGGATHLKEFVHRA